MRRRRDSRLLRQPHQLGHRDDTHLLHHAGAMFLNRAKRDAEFRADLLVEQPGDHPPEDLELSRRELRKPRTAFRHLAGTRQRLCHGEEQFVVPKRFWQKIDRPAFHRPDSHWYIAVPGDEDDLLHSTFIRELPFCCRKKVFGFAGEFASRLVRDGPRVSQSNQAGSLGRMFSVSERPKALLDRPPLPHSPAPPCTWVIISCICSLTLVRLKEAGFCIGGNSMAVSPSCRTTFWTKTNRQASRPKNSLNQAGAPSPKFKIGVRSNGSCRML